MMLGAATGAGETVAGSLINGQGFPSPQQLLLGTGGRHRWRRAGLRREPGPRPAADRLGCASLPTPPPRSITRPPAVLPEFDGTTHGVLVTHEGATLPARVGRADALPNYPNARHVEGQAAITIRETDSTGGTVYHNNPNGTCNYCHNMTSTLLPEGATLEVVPPANAVAPTPRWHDQPTTYTGNANDPKPPK